MKRHALRTIVLTSLATFGLTTAIFLPGTLQADGPTQNATAVQMPMALSTDHFELSLALADTKLASTTPGVPSRVDPGPPPKMILKATNKTGAVLTIPVKLRTMSTSLASRVSRVPSTSKDIWHYDREITLQPGASDSVDISSDANLAAGSIVNVSMSVGDKAVIPLRMAVNVPTVK